MAVKKQHMRLAEKLAQQMPPDMEDAIAVVECLALILERTHEMEEPPPSTTTLQ
jgi:hypothetical protein